MARFAPAGYAGRSSFSRFRPLIAGDQLQSQHATGVGGGANAWRKGPRGARLARHSGRSSFLTAFGCWSQGYRPTVPASAGLRGGEPSRREAQAVWTSLLPNLCWPLILCHPWLRGVSPERDLRGKSGLGSEKSVTLRSAPRLCLNRAGLSLTPPLAAQLGFPPEHHASSSTGEPPAFLGCCGTGLRSQTLSIVLPPSALSSQSASSPAFGRTPPPDLPADKVTALQGVDMGCGFLEMSPSPEPFTWM
ncbi:uncharacterized protein [Gorilla gorilla gorilla]|uniref:uncharacterized protein n=1 Tax=Gorilla gorilla gorilla TaxID=9595 RepID=UPI002445EA46|nr:uncharacterized protein LOC101124000 [Gorilla gorilla gorilla]XP_055202901.1 uncharacterized protein LOC129523644 [Gorilla gorilla gorilla]